MNKLKGQSITGLQGSALALVVLVIIVAIGATIVQSLNDTQTANDSDFNLSGDGLAALGTYADWFQIIVIVVIAALVIGLLIASFARVGNR